MKGSYFLGGGKTGLARRLSWDEPALTLTCAPAQKQTERCHPTETRPLTFREYARIQTFPDDWLLPIFIIVIYFVTFIKVFYKSFYVMFFKSISV